MGHAIGSWPRVMPMPSEWPTRQRCLLRLEIAQGDDRVHQVTLQCERKAKHRGKHRVTLTGHFYASGVLTFEGDVVD